MSTITTIGTVDELVEFVTPFVKEGIRIQQHCDLIRLAHVADCTSLHCGWPHARCPANNCRYVAGQELFLEGASWTGCDGNPHLWCLDDSKYYKSTLAPVPPVLLRSSRMIIQRSEVFPDRTKSLPTIKEDLPQRFTPPELARIPSKDYRDLSDASTQPSDTPESMEDLS